MTSLAGGRRLALAALAVIVLVPITVVVALNIRLPHGTLCARRHRRRHQPFRRIPLLSFRQRRASSDASDRPLGRHDAA